MARIGRRWRTTLILGLLGAAAIAGPVLAAPAEAVGSLSDTTPQPGQTITVTASGLLPNGDVVLDYLPDGVRLAVFKNGPNGSFSHQVRIPDSTYDGAKQVFVTALNAAGRFARLHLDLTISGPPASAVLSDLTLVPKQVVRFTGTRWYAGGSIVVLLFPEGENLGPVTAGSDGRFSVDLRMPELLLNGRHGIQVFGRSAGGRMANLKIFPTVSGGVGQAGAVEFPDEAGLLPTTSTSSTTSTTSRATSTTARPDASASPLGGNNALVILVGLCLLAIVVVIVTWLRSADGRHWLQQRQRRRG